MQDMHLAKIKNTEVYYAKTCNLTSHFVLVIWQNIKPHYLEKN